MKKPLLTLLISTSLIGTSQALTFTNSNTSSSSTSGQINTTSEASIIGQSIYKTITQGDAKIYQAQMLLNRYRGFPSPGTPNRKWISATKSAVRDFYKELGQILMEDGVQNII